MIFMLEAENSRIRIGCMNKETILFTESLSADLSKTALEYAVSFRHAFEFNHLSPADVEGAILASVVPQLNSVLLEAVKKATGCGKILTVGPGVKSGLNIKIDDPARLGSDRVVGAVAAVNGYPLPLILIDMSTCLTFSVLNEKGAYIGGSIAPGLRLSLDALTNKAALLSQVPLTPPAHVTGRNTQECIQSGILLGGAALVDGMLDRLSETLSTTPTYLATGWDASLLAPLCRHRIEVDEDLFMKGLYAIYQKNA